MCQVNGAGLMLVRVGRLAEALSQLEEALAVSRDLAAQDAREEALVPLTYAHVYEEAQVPLPSYPFLSAPILTSPHLCSRMLTYSHVCSHMLTYAHIC
jgi:hypothetical protein